MRHCGRDIPLGLVAHTPELCELFRVVVAVDRQHGDALLAHLLPRIGGHRFELRTVGDEVELPEALPPLFLVAALRQHADAEVVVLPGPAGEGLRAIGARAFLHRREERVEALGCPVRREDVAADVAVALWRLPLGVALHGVRDAPSVELADEALDLRVLVGVPPVVLVDHRILRVVWTNGRVEISRERGVLDPRLAEGDVACLHRSFPVTLSRATMPSCRRYCPISRRPNFDAPSSRSRNGYRTSTIRRAFARAITSNPILKPMAFSRTPSMAERRTAKNPLVASRTGTSALPSRQATRDTTRRRSGQSSVAPPET